MSFDTYKDITQADMMNYIAENAPKEKEWFKSVALVDDANGKKRYHHLRAKKEFCKKFKPDLLPSKKEKKQTKTSILENW